MLKPAIEEPDEEEAENLEKIEAVEPAPSVADPKFKNYRRVAGTAVAKGTPATACILSRHLYGVIGHHGGYLPRTGIGSSDIYTDAG